MYTAVTTHAVDIISMNDPAIFHQSIFTPSLFVKSLTEKVPFNIKAYYCVIANIPFKIFTECDFFMIIETLT